MYVHSIVSYRIVSLYSRRVAVIDDAPVDRVTSDEHGLAWHRTIQRRGILRVLCLKVADFVLAVYICAATTVIALFVLARNSCIWPRTSRY